MKKIPVSTTSFIDGYDIAFNVGFVSSHVVAGTNIFSDVLASLSDIFGGRSASYKKQLASIKNEVIEELIEETKKIGGDGLVGVSIDFDEVSGNGKSMFMVTATGTAVKLAQGDVSKPHLLPKVLSTEISKEQLQIMRLKAELLDLDSKGKLTFTDEQVKNIAVHQFFELSTPLLEYFKKVTEIGYPTLLRQDTENALLIFERMDPTEAEKIIYSYVGTSLTLDTILYEISTKLGLIDYERIAEIILNADLKSKQNALYFIKIDKTKYYQSDIDKLTRLIEAINTSFSASKVYEVKKLMGSKSVWKCYCDTENDEESVFCKNCYSDILGFKKDAFKPKEAIVLLKNDIEILRTNFG
jgi:uncharacterized protein YbjQ (UPF0145 family)